MTPATMVTPGRSLEQRMDALTRANVVRVARKDLKRDLKAGRVLASEVLLDPDDVFLTMKVFALLLAVPGFGRVKANKTLALVKASPSKTLEGLSYRQRMELVKLLQERGR